MNSQLIVTVRHLIMKFITKEEEGGENRKKESKRVPSERSKQEGNINEK